MIKTIKKDVEAEIVVKKSKFISHIYYIESEEEAKNIINQTSKKYYDAKHNCYAYVVQEKSAIIERSSDNGEPNGTAGAPLCNVIKKNNLCNILIIVTRYFGGILLGTGGLVKAYTDSALKALEEAEICNKELGNKYEIEIEYDKLKTFKYICNKLDIKRTNIEYLQNINITIETTKEKFEKLVEDKGALLNYKLIEENIWIG